MGAAGQAGSRARRSWLVCAAALLVGGVGACAETSPTSLDPDDVPGQIRTVEVEIPWSEFGTTLQSFSGFGRPADIGVVLVADGFAGVLNSRALVRFPALPTSATVRDSSGALVIDSAVTVQGGRIIFNAIVSDADSTGAWEFTASELTQPWDPSSATWESAVDSGGLVVAWDEPGAGPVRLIDSAVLQLADTADSIVIELDAQTIASWGDSASERSVRFDLASPDTRVRLGNVRVRYELGSSIDPDTTVVAEVSSRGSTFVYTPGPGDPAGVIRTGGAPAWRSVFGLDIPTVLNGPEALCEVAGCPYTLEPGALNRASIVLRTRSSPTGFEPQDTVFLDTRPVLAPDVLPKSPLGGSFIGSISVPPGAFGTGSGEPLEVQITGFVRGLLDPDADGSEPSSIALLSAFEPLDVAVVEFDGPLDPGAPLLRLLVTVSDRVNYR